MRRLLSALVLALVCAGLLAPAGAPAQAWAPAKRPVAVGVGGAAATVDVEATRAAIGILRRGGNAVDAAVGAAAVLGVVEPYSCGIGGGGFLVAYLARQRRVVTVEHREAAPAAFTPTTFLEDGEPIPFPEAVTSGLGVGVPGTVRGWDVALRRYGTMPLRKVLWPAIRVARRGFIVDETFAAQTEANLERFRDFTTTSGYFLTEDGQVPPVGSRLRNPDLARTYTVLARFGPTAFYRGRIATDIAQTVQHPPLRPGAERRVRPGLMTRRDLAAYTAPVRQPTVSDFRGLAVRGMGPPSSGGSTVGESLNILEHFAPGSREEAFHLMLEASALAFADRNAYLGDPDYVDVPLRGLLSDAFAAERASLIGPTAATKPVAEGDPWPYEGRPRPEAAGAAVGREGRSTTHLTTWDRHGNVVSYTFTIEQTGGSGIAVGGRGFLLNNELTDFNFQPGTANSPDAGKRPRSSMSPTIVLRDGKPLLAGGSPGGATIITTVLQVLYDRFELGTSLPEAVAAPRASQLNIPTVVAEPGFLTSPLAAALETRGHAFTEVPEIGAVTAIERLPGGRLRAVAEPTRRGGGSAMVVRPRWRR